MIKSIFFIAILFIPCYAMARSNASGKGIEVRSVLGPTDAIEADITLSAAGSSLHNCITDLVVSSTGTYTFRILDGGTTNFTLQQAADSAYSFNRTIDTAFCGSANTALTLKVENVVATEYYINFEGYVRD